MIKLKFLVEKKKDDKKEEKEDRRVYPEIIMLPDAVMETEKFVEFMKEVYNIEINVKEKEEK